MGETITVPRVFRRVECRPGFNEVIGGVASKLFGIQLEFDHADLREPQLTLLGSGEMVGFHMRTNAFSNVQMTSAVYGRINRSMPDSFSQRRPDLAIDELQLRTVTSGERRTRALIGVVKSPDIVLERSRAIGTVLASSQSRDKRLTNTKSNGGSFKIAFCDEAQLTREDLVDLLGEATDRAFIDASPGTIASASIKLDS
jgi:hypothetical protein